MTSLRARSIRPNRAPGAARRRLAGAAMGIVALGTLAAGCGTSQNVERTVTAAVVDGGAGFTPATVTVNKTDNVTITVENSTDRTHGFSIVGYGVEEQVEAGQPIEVEFRASRAGTYEIRCQLHPAHKTGTLVVE